MRTLLAWRRRADLEAERERRRIIRMTPRWPIHLGLGPALTLIAEDDAALGFVETGQLGLYLTAAVGYRKAFRWLASVQTRVEVW